MKKPTNPNQIAIQDFFLPFGGKLDPENRWVKTADLLPWDIIDEFYMANMSEDKGRQSLSSRIAFGACYIRESEDLTDREVVQAVSENPYMQYFLGLLEFTTKPVFDASSMVHFRKRFPVNFVAAVNEYICTGKWPEGMRDVDRNHDDNDDSPGGGSSDEPLPDPVENEIEHKGKLVMDATVAPADIRYPTDASLLNQARENLETIIKLVWCYVPHNNHEHMLPYNAAKAHSSYMDIAKAKRPSTKKIRRVIGEQIRYVNLALDRFYALIGQFPEVMGHLVHWMRQRLQVIPVMLAQQTYMYENNIRRCDNRIVSLEQPHVRPIVRGKKPNPTEFGQKIHLSVVDGYAYIEQTSWENFNESQDLYECIREFYRRFGCYPEAILADQIYQTRANKKLCKSLGIRLSGKPLGRRSKEQQEDDAKQIYQDSCERNVVESRNGNLKRRFGLNRIMCKTDENSKTEMAFNVLAMNVARKLREHFSRIFSHLFFWHGTNDMQLLAA